MGIISCEILFESNPQCIFYAGQTLSGRVELTLNSPKSLRGITLKLSGVAHCSWTQHESVRVNGKNVSRSVTYSGHEDYLHTLTYLAGSSDGEITLPAGKHTYTFSCVLPLLLPSSFEGSNGYVRYTAKVTLDRPWKFDQTYKTAFTVLSPLDLNYNPNCRLPLQGEAQKTFCCGPCASGPLMLTAQMSATGYVPGQAINITCDINNVSNVEVEEIKFILRKYISYHSTTPRSNTRSEKINLAEKRSNGVAVGKSEKIQQSLVVPPVAPSNLDNCRIIDIRYEVKVEAVVAGLHTNLEVLFPIIIGTVPLAPLVPHPNPGMVPYPNQSIPYPGPANQSQPFPYPGQPTNGAFSAGPSAPPDFDTPPPSYEECQFGTTSIHDDGDSQHTMGTKNFAPRYPVFQFKQ